MKEVGDDVRKFIAYDKAIANLKEAGLADAFIKAVEHDPEIQKTIEKIAPKHLALARVGWSCCVTVEDPL
ncbi:MAG TPA: hypothetical protein VLU94_01160 [Candidatus Nitrosotalea sp.]|nr:hypothetical protein [Candidatus Nitrosotalea sp.]